MKKLKSVLLIDDDAMDNLVHQRAIKKAGDVDEILTETHADRALESLRSGAIQPDMIFLDINMPGMDGWQFLAAYEQLPPEQSRAPVVMMLTTSTHPDDAAKAKEHGMVRAFQNKPLTPELFQEIVHDFFGDA